MKTSILILFVLLIPSTAALAITYPYVAPRERQTQIKQKYPHLKAGMTGKEVTALLGKPDLVTELYDQVKARKPVGSTLWYVLSQQKEHGSVIEVQRRAVAIRLDMTGRVTRVEPMGL